MNDFNPIAKLTTLVVFITIGLFAFTLISKDKFEEQTMLRCATVETSTFYDSTKIAPLVHPGLKVFQQNCKSCHRINQKLLGPALRGSFESHDSVWFVRMIISAKELRASGDTLAIRLFNDYHQTEHPDFKEMRRDDLNALVEYLKTEGMKDYIIF